MASPDSRTDAPGSWPGSQRYADLEKRILAAMRPTLTEPEFDALALEIHAFQREANPPYARWCATLPAPTHWSRIPAVPQAMFKRFRLACFPPGVGTKVFRTSGTTGETRGEHHFLNARLYDASVLAGWQRMAFPRAHPVVLVPRARHAPDSSLSRMMRTVARSMSPDGEPTWLCEPDGRLDVSLLDAVAHADWCRHPVALLGTALAFLNFFERLVSPRLHLAPGSFAVETGGFKGSGRDLAKPELYAMFRERLGLDPRHVWNEYGMCELSSQFYTRGIGAPHTSGPWVRALVVSPETGEEVPVGELGVLRIFDLANLGSVLAIETADLAIRHTEGFELLGRNPTASPRGCSRAADEKMRAPASRLPAQAQPHEASAAPRPFRAATPLLTFPERAAAVAQAAAQFDFIGPVTAASLTALATAELGHAAALDDFAPYGTHRARALAPRTILHILSANTPAAAVQTLMRGLLLGSHNLCKVPARGMPELDAFIAALPPALQQAITLSVFLPADWLPQADAIIVFGNDETVARFRARAQPWQTFIAHGHKLSFGIVFDDPAFESVAGAARDVAIFDQQGCLSPHVFYVRESATLKARDYAARLADAMRDHEAVHPRGTLMVTESNRIRALREEIAFRAANGEPIEAHASADTAWTVVLDSTPGFPISPLNRVVFVKALPPSSTAWEAELAPVAPYLSACGIWPSTPQGATFAMATGATRICPIGTMQHPPLTWHQDAQPVLAPLVRWVDWETVY